LLVAVELLVQLMLELGIVVLILGKERLAVGVSLATTETGRQRHNEGGLKAILLLLLGAMCAWFLLRYRAPVKAEAARVRFLNGTDASNTTDFSKQ
jgi:hypothetical protein